MDITLEKKSPTEGLIKIKLIQDDYQPKVEEKVKEYSQKANLKGFRKGKVPKGLIKKMYGKSILVDEINHLISHSLNDYIKSNDLKIIGEPLPDRDEVKKIDWDNQTEFNFNYEIGLIEDFSVEISKKVKVKQYQIQPDQKTINKTIERLQKQYGESSDAELSKEGDTLLGEIQEIEGELTKECMLEIDEINKKERDKFIGIKPEDSIEFDIKRAFKDLEYLSSQLGISVSKARKLKGKFRFTNKKISRIKKAELNQEFFDKVFGKEQVNSLDSFKEKVKEEIKKGYQREADQYLDYSIRETLTEKTKMNLPQDFLKKWLFYTNEEKVSKDTIEEEYDSYAKELKWSLIKNKIEQDHGLKVENKDVIDKTKSMIRQQFGGALTEEMEKSLDTLAQNYLQGEDGQNYMKVFNQIRSEKIFQLIKEKITIVPKKVKAEEFSKIVQQ